MTIHRSTLACVVLISLTAVALSDRLSDPPKKPVTKPDAPSTEVGQARWEYLIDRLDKSEARADSLQQQVSNAQHDAETAWIFVFSLTDRIKKLADKIERVEIQDE